LAGGEKESVENVLWGKKPPNEMTDLKSQDKESVPHTGGTNQRRRRFKNQQEKKDPPRKKSKTQPPACNRAKDRKKVWFVETFHTRDIRLKKKGRLSGTGGTAMKSIHWKERVGSEVYSAKEDREFFS